MGSWSRNSSFLHTFLLTYFSPNKKTILISKFHVYSSYTLPNSIKNTDPSLSRYWDVVVRSGRFLHFTWVNITSDDCKNLKPVVFKAALVSFPFSGGNVSCLKYPLKGLKVRKWVLLLNKFVYFAKHWLYLTLKNSGL